MTDPARPTHAQSDAGAPGAAAADGAAGESTGDVAHPATPSRPLELVGAAVALAVSVALLIGAQRIGLRVETGGIDPRWWPTVLGGAGAVLSTVLLASAAFRSVGPREDLQAASPEGWRRLALALASTVALVLLWPLLGFVPAAALFLLGLTYLLGGRGWGTLLLFPAVTAGCLHLLFSVALEVPL